eukprot:1664848-Pleurochrysis_carterae.AAC.1
MEPRLSREGACSLLTKDSMRGRNGDLCAGVTTMHHHHHGGRYQHHRPHHHHHHHYHHRHTPRPKAASTTLSTFPTTATSTALRCTVSRCHDAYVCSASLPDDADAFRASPA